MSRIEPFRELLRRQNQLTTEELNRLLRATEQQSYLNTGQGYASYKDSVGNFLYNPEYQRQSFRARLTAVTTVSGINRYTWEQVQESGDGTFTTQTEDGMAGSGYSESDVANYIPAFEYNNALIDVPTYVQLEWGYGDFLFFRAPRQLTVANQSGTVISTENDIRELRFDTADGFSLTEVSPGIVRVDFTAASGGSSTITVEAADTSPSYTAITTLRFDESDGFVITNPSAGIARIDMQAASHTDVGIVNLVSQYLGAGTKSMDAVITGTCTGTVFRINSTAIGGSTPDASVSYSINTASSPYSALIIAGDVSQSNAAVTLEVSASSSNPRCILRAVHSGATYPATKYSVQNSGGTISDGVGGTDALGNVFKGGILTTLGGGSVGTGTVTSVALTVPTEFSVSGSPVTSSGTLAITWANATANYILAGPTSGGAAAPTLRAMVTADIPNGIVTKAKIENVAADKLLGRGNGGGAGAPQEISLGSGLTMTGTTLNVVGGSAGTFQAWTSVTKLYTDFTAASTSQTINLYTLAAKEVLHAVVIKSNIAWSGGSLAMFGVDIIVNGSSINTTWDLMSAVSDTNFLCVTPGSVPYLKSFTATDTVQITATSSGANVNAATAGSVTVYLLTSTLP